MVPVLNLVMSVPLKVSAATSGVLLGDGKFSCNLAIRKYWSIDRSRGRSMDVRSNYWRHHRWPICFAGIKASLVRNILIAMLFLTSLKLTARGVEGLSGINIPIF